MLDYLDWKCVQKKWHSKNFLPNSDQEKLNWSKHLKNIVKSPIIIMSSSLPSPSVPYHLEASSTANLKFTPATNENFLKI